MDKQSEVSTQSLKTSVVLRTVREVLRDNYVIRPQQRPYRWFKEATVLLKDLVDTFNSNYSAEHEPTDRINYTPLFLDQITINVKRGANHLTDGQQRLTTLDLILIAIKRRLDGNGPDLNMYLCNDGLAGRTLNIKDKRRVDIMNALIDGKDYTLSEIPSPTEKNILKAFKAIQANLPKDFYGEKLIVFTHWLLDLVNISVTSHGEGIDEVKTFERANSRSLPLTSSEKYVSHMFDEVSDEDKTNAMDDVIQDALTKVSNLTHSEWNSLDKFCISLHQAKHAKTAGTSDVADFDKITKSVDVWIKDNGLEIGIFTAKEKYKFITEDFKELNKYYLEIVQAMVVFNPELPHVYAAGKRIPYLPSILLASLSAEDSKETRYKKINTIAWFMIRFRVFYTWNGDTRKTDGLRTEILSIIKAVRNECLVNIVKNLSNIVDNNSALRELSLEAPSYVNGGDNKSFVYMGIILTDLVEVAAGKPSLLVEYLDGIKDFPTEGEHAAPLGHDWTKDFDSFEEFIFFRNQFGGFGFIPKSFNASYNKKPYTEKIVKYPEQNTYIGLVSPTYYDENQNLVNNKGLVDLEKASGVKFKPYPEFGKELISGRNNVARNLLEYFFDIENLYVIAGLEKPELETNLPLTILGAVDSDNIVEVSIDTPMVFA